MSHLERADASAIFSSCVTTAASGWLWLGARVLSATADRIELQLGTLRIVIVRKSQWLQTSTSR